MSRWVLWVGWFGFGVLVCLFGLVFFFCTELARSVIPLARINGEVKKESESGPRRQITKHYTNQVSSDLHGEKKIQAMQLYSHSWCPVLAELCVSASSRGHRSFPTQLVHEHHFSSQRLGGRPNAARAPYVWMTGTSPQPEPRGPAAE